MHTKRKLWAKPLVAAAVLALGAGSMAACSTGGGSSSESGSSDAAGSADGLPAYMVPAKEGPYTVGFSNSFAGNAYRTQMIYELQAAAEDNKDQVKDLIITDADNSVDKQISDINDLLTKGIDILLIDAASETALNSAVARAHEQGVLVVSFDNPVSSENGIVAGISNVEFGEVGGKWLADQLAEGDEIFTLDGVAGTPVDQQRLEGAKSALDPAGVKIVANAATDWDQAKGQAAALDLLSAHPDVAGIYSQGGAPSLGALNALAQKGAPLIPIPGEGYNGFLKKWAELKESDGWESIAPCNPPSLAADALDLALEIIKGEDKGQNIEMEMTVITQENLDEYVRPDLPDAFFLPTRMSEEAIQTHFGSN